MIFIAIVAILAILVYLLWTLAIRPLVRPVNTIGGTGILLSDPASPVNVDQVVGYIRCLFPNAATDIESQIYEGRIRGHQVKLAQVAGTIAGKTMIALNPALNQGDYAMEIFGEWQRTYEGQNHYSDQNATTLNPDLVKLENYLILNGMRPAKKWRH